MFFFTNSNEVIENFPIIKKPKRLKNYNYTLNKNYNIKNINKRYIFFKYNDFYFR